MLYISVLKQKQYDTFVNIWPPHPSALLVCLLF